MTGYTFADPEREVVDYLNAEHTEPVSVSFPLTGDALQVAWDGTPTVDYPVTERATVRVTAWASKPTDAKALAGRAQASMLSFPGSPAIYAIHPLTGRLPGRDPETGRYFCSFTCRVSTRATAVA